MIDFKHLDRELFVIGQSAVCQVQGIKVTAYRVSKWLKCTPVTARRLLVSMAQDGYIDYSIDNNHPRQAQVVVIKAKGYRFLSDHRQSYIDMILSLFVFFIREEINAS